jgi:hypothetical protein
LSGFSVKKEKVILYILGEELGNFLVVQGAAVTDFANLSVLDGLAELGSGGVLEFGGDDFGLFIEEGQDVVRVGDSSGGQVADQSLVALSGFGIVQGDESIVLLKGLVLGAALLSRRGKRSAENDYAFIALNNAEPASCYKRLICDLATGAIPDSDNILSLFNEETEVISPKFEYSTAAKLGKAVKNAQVCEVRYSCPLNNQEIAKLFA